LRADSASLESYYGCWVFG